MYEHIEQLNDRKKEKLALFLTLENMAGLLVAAGPIFIISTAWPLPSRLLALLLSATVGVVATLDRQGMPLYRRVSWRVQGWVWVLTQRRTLRPELLRGSGAPAGAQMRPGIPQSRIVRRHTAELQQARRVEKEGGHAGA